MSFNYDNIDINETYRLSNFMQDAFSEDEDAISEEDCYPIYAQLKVCGPRYEFAETIAKGGMKEIKKVFDHQTERYVAMAQLHSTSPKELYEPFLREAMLTAKLAHPNIMTIHDIGLDADSRPYFTMELKIGDNLDQTLKKYAHRQDPSVLIQQRTELLHIFLKIGEAVSYAHSRGLLHLDLKPANIQIGEHGEVLVCDWGLGKIIGSQNNDEEADIDELLLDADLLNNMTLKGHIKGTPGFMAPEQAESGGHHDEQTDIYALGCILYTILVGTPPFSGTTKEILQQLSVENLVAPIKAYPHLRVPQSLNAVVIKATERLPNQRYAKVDELIADVQQYLAGHATGAENASFLKLLHLLYLRNRTLVLSLSLVMALTLVLTLAFIRELNLKEKDATAAYMEAKRSLNLYLESTQKFNELSSDFQKSLLNAAFELKDKEDYPGALDLIDKILVKNNNANLWMEHGNLNMSMLRFAEADKSYKSAGYSGNLAILSSIFAQKQADHPLTPLDFEQLFSSYLGYAPLKNRMLSYHGKITKKASEHANVICSYLIAINPGFKRSDFNYDDDRKSLKISSLALKKLNYKDGARGKALDGLHLLSLDVSGTGLLDLTSIHSLNLVYLNISNTAVQEFRLLKQFPALDKLVISSNQLDEIKLLKLPQRIEVIISQ